MEDLKGQVALVTGAGRGIGARAAVFLAQKGARVALISRTEGEVQQVAAEIRGGGGEAKPFVCDIASRDEVFGVFDAIQALWGPVTLLVNNAAMAVVKPFLQLNADDWQQTFQVNVMGAVFASQAAFSHMKKAGRGSIVNVSSLGGLERFQKFDGFSAYSVSKHGLVGLTECLSVEGRPLNIAVNCVAPGAVDTKMLRDVAPGFKTAAKPEDVARLIVFLCEEGLAGRISGSVMPLCTNS